jgi:hypothetical protein
MVYINVRFFIAFNSITLLILLALSNPSASGIFLVAQKAFAQEITQHPPDDSDGYTQHHHHHARHSNSGLMDEEIIPTILSEGQ